MLRHPLYRTKIHLTSENFGPCDSYSSLTCRLIEIQLRNPAGDSSLSSFEVDGIKMHRKSQDAFQTNLFIRCLCDRAGHQLSRVSFLLPRTAELSRNFALQDYSIVKNNYSPLIKRSSGQKACYATAVGVTTLCWFATDGMAPYVAVLTL